MFATYAFSNDVRDIDVVGLDTRKCLEDPDPATILSLRSCRKYVKKRRRDSVILIGSA